MLLLLIKVYNTCIFQVFSKYSITGILDDSYYNLVLNLSEKQELPMQF